MKEGLLWYDASPGRDLAGKIGRAAQRYHQKFGTAPNTCYVHPSTLNDVKTEGGNSKVREISGIHVIPLSTVLRHHFWIGQEETQQHPNQPHNVIATIVVPGSPFE